MTPPKLPLSTSTTPFRISRLSDESEALRIPSLWARLWEESQLRLRPDVPSGKEGSQKRFPDQRVGRNVHEEFSDPLQSYLIGRLKHYEHFPGQQRNDCVRGITQ